MSVLPHSKLTRKLFFFLRRSLSTGTLKYPDDEHFYTFNSAHLQDLGAIGNGNFGTVYKMRHRETNKLIAVKVRFHFITKFFY